MAKNRIGSNGLLTLIG